MVNKPDFPLRVFYDGSCVVCATEIEHYMRKECGGNLVAIDISDPEFDPTPYGITLDAFMYELHAVDRDGVVYRGIAAFQAIWHAFPSSSLYGAMSILIALPLVNRAARFCYRLFARIRPYLPKRHNCKNGSCRIDNRR